MKVKEVTIHRLARETIQIPDGKNPRVSSFKTVEVSKSYTLEEPTAEEVEKMEERLAAEVWRELERDITDLIGERKE